MVVIQMNCSLLAQGIFVFYIFLIHTKLSVSLSSCSWTTADGYRAIDLGLYSSGKIPQFSVNYTNGSLPYKYTWDPCRGFWCGLYQTASVCQKLAIFPPRFLVLGERSSSKLLHENSDFILQYTNNTKTTKIYLICRQGSSAADFSFISEESGIYKLNFTSEQSCPIHLGLQAGGLSVGSVLLIIFVVFVAVYIVAGLLINYLVQDETGADIFPNKEFWFSLPGLIKDGFLFLVGKVRPSSYDSI